MSKKKTRKNKGQKGHETEQLSFKQRLLKALFLGSIWGAIALFLLVIYYAHDLPDVSKINEDTRQPAITIYDRDGGAIATIGDMYGEYIKYKEFPKVLVNAVLSTEDRKFFQHPGIDIFGMMRAFVINTISGRVVQGGSTITQQLAKIVYLSHERTIKRKIQELAFAFYLENKFTKEQILTMYLNRIYTGSGNYGMEAAAQSYFGKSVRDVNVTEAAVLAGLIKAPSRYSPANNSKLSLERAYQVMLNMVDNEKLKESSLPKSGKLEYRFQPTRARVSNKAPYFTDWIREQLPDYIGNYTSGNIEVYTTLDTNLQRASDEALRKSLAANAVEHKVGQGALLAMSPSGEILAMTGGKSYSESQFNRATQALRQPGSAFKLFVYLAALENGYEPDSVIEDAPIKIKDWSPENYDGRYLGDITIREAFAKSINTVAVRLARDVGMKKVSDMAYKLGVTEDINKDLSSALGTSEVTLMELTGAFAHLANYGNAVWTHGIRQIKVNGEVAYERQKSGDERLISEDITAKMNDLLKSVVTDGTGRNAQLPFETAGKTGTTQNLRDAWFIGFSGDYVAGVWMGNDDNTSMDKIAGGSLPALVWREFMKEAESDRSPHDIPTDSGVISEGRPKDSPGIWEGIVKSLGGE